MPEFTHTVEASTSEGRACIPNPLLADRRSQAADHDSRDPAADHAQGDVEQRVGIGGGGLRGIGHERHVLGEFPETAVVTAQAEGQATRVR